MMRRNLVQSIGLVLVAAIGLTACSGLGKLAKKADTITYKVSPDPIEMHGDSVVVKVSGTFPEKLFPKKAIVTVIPTIKYNGGEKSLEPIILLGEKVEGETEGTTIPYAGGSFSYTSKKVAYVPEMEVATVELKADGAVKKKTKELPGTKVADGTIITPLLVKSDDKALIGKDNFQKTEKLTQAANIFFVVNQAQVRGSEMNSKDLKALKAFIKDGKANNFVFTGMNVSAYASPDGELSINSNLAENRAATATAAIKRLFKGIESAKGADFYNKVVTAEDWDGFKAAMEASSIEDKALILRVLTMYPDGETREKEIKNLAATYTEVAGTILPQLRRAVLTLNAERLSKSDEEITALVASNPDTLSVEEILYAATLTKDLNVKADIYTKAEKAYPRDWRTSNNLGYVYLMLNKVNEADQQFKKAALLAADNAIVKNNQGIVARWRGDRATAAQLYTEASANTEISSAVLYNMGIVDIQNGEYAAAVNNFGEAKTFNAALAKLLSGAKVDAMATVDESADKNTALAYYLKAIAGARNNKVDVVVDNLKLAILKDASFKEKAADDAEFIQYRTDDSFKAMVGL